MRRRSQVVGSFTLIELLVVIAIIGILAGLLLAAAGGVRGQAARSQAKTEIAALDGALTRFFTDQGFYPGSTGVLPPPRSVRATTSRARRFFLAT